MKNFVADLHLHSSFARATSKDLNFETLTTWARYKGIDLLSSADFTHPVWFETTKKNLKDTGEGFFSFNGLKFVLGAEVSCIFSQGGRLRRVHLLLYAPSLQAAEKINQELGKRGKLGSDGRPILGQSARNILEIILEADEKSIMIPAHVWTPWFGVYGANGGFNSLEECFGDLTKYIYAVETGLSSDPEMNWRVKELDKRSIVSFSDAHSAPKMGRELTIFSGDFTYAGFLAALKQQTLDSTIEFFPEEGKYHYNGHRNCNFTETPTQTRERGTTLCPVCKRPLTIGVMHRVEELAEKDREEGFVDRGRAGFKKLVGLLSIIAEVKKAPITSSKVKATYFELIEIFGTEIEILSTTNVKQLEEYLPKLGEGVAKVRSGDIFIDPGYDGVYGTVKIWPVSKTDSPKTIVKEDREQLPEDQLSLF